MERRILVECKVRAHPIVVGGVIRQQMAEVPFAQHHEGRGAARVVQPLGAFNRRFRTPNETIPGLATILKSGECFRELEKLKNTESCSMVERIMG